MNAGDTLIVALPNTSVDSHLWVVISDPTQSDDVLIVNFTSWREDKDQACVLNKDDHPYISRRTCVNYRGAKICNVDDLETLIQSGTMNRNTPVAPQILDRIRVAVLESRISQDHAQLLVDQGLVDF